MNKRIEENIKKQIRCCDCKHRTEYEAVGNRDHKIFICSGDGWDDNNCESGEYNLLEVSNFDASDCLLFLNEKADDPAI